MGYGVMNANPWKDPLYRLIDEYGGLAIPKGEREEWREVIPLGLRRKYRDARQPDAFVQACIEDGRCQEYGIRDTRDLHRLGDDGSQLEQPRESEGRSDGWRVQLASRVVRAQRP